MTISAADVEPWLHRMFIDAAGTSLREEDKKKAIEVAALLNELARVGTSGALVDVAAGKSYVGLLAVELLGFSDVTVIERDEKQLANAKHGATKLTRTDVRLVVRGSISTPRDADDAKHEHPRLSLCAGDVRDVSLWPVDARVAIGLHACGPASDGVIDAAIEREVKWLLLVPCCYSSLVSQWEAAHRRAEELGIADGEVRKQFVQSFIDSERALRLEAAGYETECVSFVAPTVTPHHVLFRARRLMNPKRMAAAVGRRARLLTTAGVPGR
ncbi:MAG: methyltransferase [Archangium sp.]|nr:methyltransferase [Archangium sp.]